MFVLLYLFILIPLDNYLVAKCHATVPKASKMFEHVVNSLPEVDKPLSAKYAKSFAYPTFKERVPAIIQGIADGLKNKEEIKEKYGEEALQEVDIIIEKILNLKNGMQSDKPLEEIIANGKLSKEVNVYNKIIKEKQLENAGNPPTWFQTEWLFAECYTYFKIYEIFYVSKTLNKYDPFMKVKNDTLLGSKNAVIKLCEYVAGIKANGSFDEKAKKEAFIFLLKCSLWGNKADLSLSGGKAVAASDDIYTEMNKFDQYVLVDDLEETYKLLNDDTHDKTVDIVLDNAGYELYNDLCYADFLIHSGLVKKIIFHGKAIPWFVSDVTPNDFNFTFDLLSNHVSEKTASIAKEWCNYLKNGQWVFNVEPFWILPYDYSKMASADPELYAKLGENKLVIFKGDLNYRKLVGDIYWEPTTSFEKALRGFAPTNVLALRTVKADTISGLKKGVFEELTQKDPSWLLTGQYALIQLLKKN